MITGAFVYNFFAATYESTIMKRSALSTFAAVILLTASVAPAAAQDPNTGRDLSAACFTCHGTNGNSVGAVPPGLAGRDRAELFQAMKDFQSGKRPATIMHQQAKGYSDPQLQAIAAYIAMQKPAAARVPPKSGY
jgi:sulfide dehydrogenase cytochrome subunit